MFETSVGTFGSRICSSIVLRTTRDFRGGRVILNLVKKKNCNFPVATVRDGPAVTYGENKKIDGSILLTYGGK